MKLDISEAIRRVLRKAAAAGVSDLIPTDLWYGVGFRDSVAPTSTGYDLDRIIECTEDIDAANINWPLSAPTGFAQLLVAEFHNEIRTEWRLLFDCCTTMDFGTADIKRVLGAT